MNIMPLFISKHSSPIHVILTKPPLSIFTIPKSLGVYFMKNDFKV
jgi:hypothetical protein